MSKRKSAIQSNKLQNFMNFICNDFFGSVQNVFIMSASLNISHSKSND